MSANPDTTDPIMTDPSNSTDHPRGDNATVCGIPLVLLNADPDTDFGEIYDRCVEAGHIDPEAGR